MSSAGLWQDIRWGDGMANVVLWQDLWRRAGTVDFGSWGIGFRCNRRRGNRRFGRRGTVRRWWGEALGGSSVRGVRPEAFLRFECFGEVSTVPESLGWVFLQCAGKWCVEVRQFRPDITWLWR
jgi:hypothetical protein